RLLPLLKEAQAQCVVISFDLAAVLRARQAGGVAIGWVLDRYDAHSRLKYEASQPEYLFCDLEKLPAEGSLWHGPWQGAIYGIESMASALALAGRGVHYIETMAVQAMSAALSAAQSASSVPAAHD